MAVSTTDTEITYTGNGSTVTPYVIPFAFLDTDHIEVGVSIDGNVDPETLGPGDFTVTRAGDGQSGSVRTTAAVSSPATVTIARVTPMVQSSVFQTNGPFPARAAETALDRLEMQIQERDADLAAVSTRVAVIEAAGDEDGEGTSPTAAARGLAKTVFLGLRTDGLAGTGTQGDPFDASTANKHDALWRAFQDSGLNYNVIYISAGTYLTHGRRHDVGAANALSGSIGFALGAANYFIEALGAGITTIKPVSFPGYAFEAHTVFYSDPSAPCTGCVIKNLTIDCNQPSLASWPANYACTAAAIYCDGDVFFDNVEVKNFYSSHTAGIEGFVLFAHRSNVPDCWDPLEAKSGTKYTAKNCNVHAGNGPSGLGYNVGIALFNSNGSVEFIDNRVYDLRNEWSGGIQFFGNGITISGNFVRSWQPIYLDTGDFDNVSIVGKNEFIREVLADRSGVHGVISIAASDSAKIFVRAADNAGSMAGVYVDIPIKPSAGASGYVVRAWLRRDGAGSAPAAPSVGTRVIVDYTTGATRNQLRDAFVSALNTHFGGAAAAVFNPSTTAILSVTPISGFVVSSQAAYGAALTSSATKLGIEYSNRANNWKIIGAYLESPRKVDFGGGGDYMLFIRSGDSLTWSRDWTLMGITTVLTGSGAGINIDIQLRSVGRGVNITGNMPLAAGWVQTTDRDTAADVSELQGTELIFLNRDSAGAQPSNTGYSDAIPGLSKLDILTVTGLSTLARTNIATGNTESTLTLTGSAGGWSINQSEVTTALRVYQRLYAQGVIRMQYAITNTGTTNPTLSTYVSGNASVYKILVGRASTEFAGEFTFSGGGLQLPVDGSLVLDGAGGLISGASFIPFSKPPIFPAYTVAQLLAMGTPLTGTAVAICSDEAGGAVLAFTSAADWRRCTDRAVIS